jgi:4-amino-4-deoxy-L-arabinose transferase-like glycosyltransferase
MSRPAGLRHAPLVLVAGGLTMLTRLDTGDLHLDGVLYAEVARAILARGEWLELTVGDDFYWRKPPLVFWLMAGTYALGGVAEAMARLPGILAGMLSAVALQAVATRLWDARVGLVAGVVLATTAPFVRNAATVRLDTVPTLLTLLCLLAYLRAADTGRVLDFAVAGACCGLAVLAKGVFGATGPFFFALYCLTTDRARLLASRGMLVSVLAAAGVALPWHVYQLARFGPAFLDVYLFEQTVDRLTGRLGGHQDARSYAHHLLRDDWPWLPFTLAGTALAGAAAWRGDRRARFLLAWAAGYLALVSLSEGRRARYLMQLYPPASILAALAVLRALPERWRARVPAAVAGLCAAGVAAYLVLPPWPRSDAAREVRALRPVLERLQPGATAVAGYRMPELPLRASFLFYAGRDLRNVRAPERPADDVVVANLARREELAALGYRAAHADRRFVVMRRDAALAPAPATRLAPLNEPRGGR